jgi:alginate O-acetyltransferase complex protein AlgI
MIFNSIEFGYFLPIVFILYWFVTNRNLKLQNLFLLVASYFFYGWWDWRFLSLIFFSSIIDFTIGRMLSSQENDSKRKTLLFVSVFVNIGLLAFFKYYNFFIDSFVASFSFFGTTINPSRLSIILPVGISFYTFQTLSYTIDVYKRKLKPSKDIVSFFAFVSFFPQLVAGPIERATNLLPQFYKKRNINIQSFTDGLRQILWGLFKKVVIADNSAHYVNQIFANHTDYSSIILMMGAAFFAFQIYCDFSGYSDIAIGTSRLFGFNLKQNFAFPYFSRDIAEFWRRWHISLSTWFRDYLYIPLGGSLGGNFMKIRNTFIIFLVSGFWHGANWTFVIWGFINACYFLPLMLLSRNRKNTDTVASNKFLPSIKEVVQIGSTFFITTIAWVFFRAESVEIAFSYLTNLFSFDNFYWSIYEFRSIGHGGKTTIYYLLFLALFIIIEWIQREKQHGLELNQTKMPQPIRWIFYYLLIASIFGFGGNQVDFIYFQF